MALSRLERAQIWLFKALMGVFFMLFQFLSSRKPDSRKLPPVSNPLLVVSATQLARKIRRREVCVGQTNSQPRLTTDRRVAAGFISFNLIITCYLIQVLELRIQLDHFIW